MLSMSEREGVLPVMTLEVLLRVVEQGADLVAIAGRRDAGEGPCHARHAIRDRLTEITRHLERDVTVHDGLLGRTCSRADHGCPHVRPCDRRRGRRGRGREAALDGGQPNVGVAGREPGPREPTR